jgi:hypothetical protein
MLDNTMKWRKQYNVATILDKPPVEMLHLFENSIPRVLYDIPDKDGHPVVIMCPGMINIKMVQANVRAEDAVACHAYEQEKNVKLCKANSKKFGRDIETVTNIINLEGLTRTHMKIMAIVKVITKADQDNYPETLNRSIIVNAPGIFTFLWGVVKGFLDPVVASKVVVAGDNYKEIFSQYFTDIKQLPKEIGGERTGVFQLDDLKLVLADHEKRWKAKPTMRDCILPKKKAKLLRLKLDCKDDDFNFTYWFKTAKKYTIFGLYFVKEVNGKTTKKVLREPQKYDSHELYVKEKLTFKKGTQGTLEILFDNRKTSTDRQLWYALELTAARQAIVYP